MYGELKQGPRVSGRIAYSWQIGFSLGATASFAYLLGSDSTYAPLMGGVDAAFTAW